MAQEDDPEARIRELEQSIANEARTSESGTQPYTEQAPPPPQPPTMPATPTFNYGAPFPMSTARTSGGFGKWWLLLAVFVVGILIVVGAIAAFGIQHFSRGGLIVGSPGTSTSAAARGSVGDRPGSASVSPSSATEGPPPGGEYDVSGFAQNKSIVCNDGVVGVSGVSNTVVIAGHCATLTVLGSQNTVTVDNADTINAYGSNNKVTYHFGSPHINQGGDSNVVEQG